MTKAEMKKMETEKKYDFVTKVYETVLKSIPATTRAYRKKVQVRVTHQNYSRYVRFHAYGQDLAFQIYGDGNVAIEMKEALHSDHVEQIFEYNPDETVQDKFIAELAEMVPCLIKVFVDKDVMDFHSYMDYVSGGDSAFSAYKLMLKEYHGITDTAKVNSVATFWLPLHIYHFRCGCDIICLINWNLGDAYEQVFE